MADTLVVMYLGKIVESGKTHEIFKQPHHPYTKALMEAKPSFDNEENTKAKGLDGVVPDPARPPQGCRFHTRCRLLLRDVAGKSTMLCVGWKILQACLKTWRCSETV